MPWQEMDVVKLRMQFIEEVLKNRSPQTVSAEVKEAMIALREAHPLWGPRKLRAWLMERKPEQSWPAASTLGELLKRRGLVNERRRRHRTPQATQPLAAAHEPNAVWATDFKGCFRVASRYCHPLTITDVCSRYLIRVQSMEAERYEPVRDAFTLAFREYGLPLRMRSDNGSPFASRATGGLSQCNPPTPGPPRYLNPAVLVRPC